MIELALYQPDMPGNLGAAIRLCACLGTPLHVIEPCGFPWNNKKIRSAAMDYIDHVTLKRHDSWENFNGWCVENNHRIVLMSTKSSQPYCDFTFQENDILLAGRESAGVPLDLHQSIPNRIKIQMNGGARSLNIINACAMILGEGLRQTGTTSS